MGACLYLRYSGQVGADIVQDYCGNTFERWTKLRYGQFAVELDNTQVEIEHKYLCSSHCPCVKVMFTDLWSEKLSAGYINATGQ